MFFVDINHDFFLADVGSVFFAKVGHNYFFASVN